MAVFNSSITTCKRRHMDLLARLRDVFQRSARVQDRLEELSPDKRLAVRQAAGGQIQ